LVVVAMTLLGGSWAAVAGDFIQMLILMPVTMVAAYLALREVGGVSAFVERLPAKHLDIGAVFDSPLMMVWVVAILLKQFISTNNLLDASRYLCVKDGNHARKAAMLAAALFLVGPIIWFIPPMAASILHPDLATLFPGLKNPTEGAFLAISIDTMPAGMLGLLLCGILAATMSSMDSGLNKNAGFFVKNFYHSVLRPHATDRELLLAGKTATGVLGLLVVWAGINFSRLEGIGLFDLMLGFGTLVAVPYAIPLVLCVFVKRTPAWSGWSTVIVGLVVSTLATHFLDAKWLEGALQLAQPLTKTQGSYWTIAVGLFLNVTVGSAWFLATLAFWKYAPAAERAQIEAFNQRMLEPLDFEREEGANSDFVQAKLLGNLSLAYGAFINLLAFIPNPISGRLSFLFCGSLVMAVGFALKRAAKKKAAEDLDFVASVTTPRGATP
jgi:Na+/proline symporter